MSYQRYRCPECGFVYAEEQGLPREGFAPGTSWGDLPEDWACPDCAVRDKVDFMPVDAQDPAQGARA